MDIINQFLALAEEVKRLRAIEDAARTVVQRWEAGYVMGKPGYESYCDLDLAILRDKLEATAGGDEDES